MSSWSVLGTVSDTDNNYWGAAVSPDGSMAAFGAGTDGVYVYNTSDRSLIEHIENVGEVDAVDFSPDGSYLGIATQDEPTSIYETAIWNEETTVSEHAVRATGIDMSDNYFAVSKAEGYNAEIWDYNWNYIDTIEEYSGVTQDVKFSPDEQWIYTARFGAINIARTSDWGHETSITAPSGWVFVINVDDDYIYISGVNNTDFHVYEHDTWAEEVTFDAGEVPEDYLPLDDYVIISLDDDGGYIDVYEKDTWNYETSITGFNDRLTHPVSVNGEFWITEDATNPGIIHRIRTEAAILEGAANFSGNAELTSNIALRFRESGSVIGSGDVVGQSYRAKYTGAPVQSTGTAEGSAKAILGPIAQFNSTTFLEPVVAGRQVGSAALSSQSDFTAENIRARNQKRVISATSAAEASAEATFTMRSSLEGRGTGNFPLIRIVDFEGVANSTQIATGEVVRTFSTIGELIAETEISGDLSIILTVIRSRDELTAEFYVETDIDGAAELESELIAQINR